MRGFWRILVKLRLMSEWKEVRLGDFLSIKHGYAFSGKNITSEETDSILVTPGNFHIGGGFKSDKFKYFNGEVPDDYVLNPGDCVVTMTDLSKATDTLGYSAIIPRTKGKQYLHNQRIGLVIPKERDDVDFGYIYWLMRSREYQWYIMNSASGTSIMHTSPTRIENYEFKLPPLDYQQFVADTLSSLDDKIDLLRRQNATLEGLAGALFREWFVEGVEEDWEEGVLGDVAEQIRDSVRKEDIHSDDRYVALEHIDRKQVVLARYASGSIATSNKSRFQKGDILFGKLRPYFHKVCFAPFAGICSTDILVIRPKEPEYFAYCLFAFFQKEVVDFATSASSGTRMPRVNWKALRSFPVDLPPEELVIRFGVVGDSMIKKMSGNIVQANELTDLRNKLLVQLFAAKV